MYIRRACEKDTKGIDRLLEQVLEVHHKGRPDLFKTGTKKYTDEELHIILMDDNRPVFAAVDENTGELLGYAFCVFIRNTDSNILTDILTLYIDDLCVDESCRGQHIGKQLYEYVLEFAKKSGCYNVTLNVWGENKNAVKFYESCGLKVQKIGMEKIL